MICQTEDMTFFFVDSDLTFRYSGKLIDVDCKIVNKTSCVAYREYFIFPLLQRIGQKLIST